MTIYCLVPQRASEGHVLNERRPGYPAKEVGYLRLACLPVYEGEGWIVRDIVHGHVFQGVTPEQALEAFDKGRVRIGYCVREGTQGGG